MDDVFLVAEKEALMADFIPCSTLVTESMFKTHAGDLGMVIKLCGVAHESADNAELNIWSEQFNLLLRNIASSEVALWTHIIRHRTHDYPDGDFDNDFCREFNEDYKARMQAQELRTNALYITVIYRPVVSKINSFFSLFDKKDAATEREIQLENIAKLNDLVTMVLTGLDRYEPKLLGCYSHNGLQFSEILEFFGFLLNGEWHRMALPREEVSDTLALSRPRFGKTGHAVIHTPTQEIHTSILNIREYPSSSNSTMLDNLLGMPFDFVLTQSFVFVQKQTAINDMKQQSRRMINAGDVAVSQVGELGEAMDDLMSNRFSMGVHHFSISIFAETRKRLNDFIALTGATLSDSGMKWGKADVEMAAAFFAQLPANFEYRPRTGKITSQNFAGFCSLHNFPIGRLNGNQWGTALGMFKTVSGAPYYFSFHKSDANDRAIAKVDRNHKELANTIVIGQSGAGKTVLEMTLLAWLQKFSAPHGKMTCVVFDKDLGASIGVRAMGGRYFAIKNGVPSGFNPFQMANTPNNITFLVSLVKRLVKHEMYPITPAQERDIDQAVKAVMAQSDLRLRRIGSVIQMLDPTSESGISARLAKWCEGGQFGWLFDNPKDLLKFEDLPIVGFDVTEFLDNEDTRTPTIMYLLHRVEALFDGRRVPIFMDEFWKLLKDDEFQDLAQNKLVTIRKQDGFLVMFTQSPKQVLQSKIAHAIVEQTATKIFLPNPSADYKDYVEGFKLTEKEYQIIRGLGEKSRQFLIKQGGSSVVAELDLKGMDNTLAVLSGNTATALLTERLIEQYGENPDVWLPEFHNQR